MNDSQYLTTILGAMNHITILALNRITYKLQAMIQLDQEPNRHLDQYMKFQYRFDPGPDEDLGLSDVDTPDGTDAEGYAWLCIPIQGLHLVRSCNLDSSYERDSDGVCWTER